ncbi:hypothetical protein EVAR_97636_1 [Eumeta japonica]|uniref:Uncharacterized protein n=1 Tax=Eumeta variegata TaxID=151549 RepID=A0A4C2AAW0_EUMVA|nr:hypothetical protein EVAR_97636_1 [Eumeta japonica]
MSLKRVVRRAVTAAKALAELVNVTAQAPPWAPSTVLPEFVPLAANVDAIFEQPAAAEAYAPLRLRQFLNCAAAERGYVHDATRTLQHRSPRGWRDPRRAWLRVRYAHWTIAEKAGTRSSIAESCNGECTARGSNKSGWLHTAQLHQHMTLRRLPDARLSFDREQGS